MHNKCTTPNEPDREEGTMPLLDDESSQDQEIWGSDEAQTWLVCLEETEIPSSTFSLRLTLYLPRGSNTVQRRAP